MRQSENRNGFSLPNSITSLAHHRRFCKFDVSGRGQVIGGVFDCEPELKKKERSAFKKLSDEEEARQRKLDMAKAMAARTEGGGKGVKDGLQGGLNNGGDVGVSGVGEGGGGFER